MRNQHATSQIRPRHIGPLRIGVGGPVGSGKTALLELLCKAMRDTYNIAVVTNDIYTQEDAIILTRAEALAADRIIGVETGGCPHRPPCPHRTGLHCHHRRRAPASRKAPPLA